VNPSKAIVTLVVGEYYTKLWKEHCEKNWNEYADRQGYDVICLEGALGRDGNWRDGRRAIASRASNAPVSTRLNGYFLHFGGDTKEDMKLLDPSITSWKQCTLSAARI